MSNSLLYKVNGIDGNFIMPIKQIDDIKYVTSQVKKEFGIIPELTAKLYGSKLQSTNIVSKCISGKDIVTFDVKKINRTKPKLEFYRIPIITPRYQSKTTFIVFSTVDYESMTIGDKINIDIETDNTLIIQEKINTVLSKKIDLKSKKMLLYLPGGIPFLKSNINEFIKSFPDFMPHLYAIIIANDAITEEILDEKFDTVCNINNPKIRTLISPDCNRETSGICEMAAVLGYIQHNGQNSKQMIYSIAKFFPFAPLICGLYSLSCLSQATGRIILQISIPLILIFKEMNKNLKISDSKLFSNTSMFLTYFMNVKISDRVPCTEFIRPFYDISFEKYFHDNYEDPKLLKIESIIAFDPDFRDQDWIKFQLPSLTKEDFQDAMNHTNALAIVPPMSLREMHRTALFKGSNGPWLFLTASISKDQKDKDKIDYINPEVGAIENDTYENIAIKAIGIDYKSKSAEFDEKVKDSIDPKKVTQIIVICIDKSQSMENPLTKDKQELFDYGRLRIGEFENRLQLSQKFFSKFTQTCYKFHTTSLYGSIMFNHKIDVRNQLNPLSNNFVERMIKKGEDPTGGTHIFEAMKTAADMILKENEGNKYPNAVLRIVVISDGEDNCKKQEIASVMNFLISNKIRVDSVVLQESEIAKELVHTSRFTGGVTFFPKTEEEGLEFFNKEEFFNMNLRQFGEFHQPNITAEEVEKLPAVEVKDLDTEIHTVPNQYASPDRVITSPSYAIAEFENKDSSAKQGQEKVHPNQKRIIQELKKIITDPDEDVLVYPLKDKVDVWRVLIKGFEGSLYDKKWFYMIVEFPPEYPSQYPLFRFVHPPFHPNISDQGRICLDTLDQNYYNEKSIREIIGEIRYLLFTPNFNSPIDSKRAQFKSNNEAFAKKVAEWNEMNGKNNAKDWEDLWDILPDDERANEIKKKNQVAIVPDQFLCPITKHIMKEPVKASSGIYYEKFALKSYIRLTANPFCRSKVDDQGKPVPLPKEQNENLEVDNIMKAKIAKWIKDNNYHEVEDEEGDESDNIHDFIKRGKSIDKPDYPRNLVDQKAIDENNIDDQEEEEEDISSNIQRKRFRPQLAQI